MSLHGYITMLYLENVTEYGQYKYWGFSVIRMYKGHVFLAWIIDHHAETMIVEQTVQIELENSSSKFLKVLNYWKFASQSGFHKIKVIRTFSSKFSEKM